MAKGWRVFVSTRMMAVPVATDQRRGAIGVDLNADHLAVAETGSSGNYVKRLEGAAGHIRQEHSPSGGSHRRRSGQRGRLCPRGRQADCDREAGLPPEEGRYWKGESRKYSRMLSSFSYGKVKAYFISRGYRKGVEVYQGQPGLQFGDRPGEVHGAVRAQRPSGCGPGAGPSLHLAVSERIPRRWACPVGNGVHVAFTVPARKGVKHVWTYWGADLGTAETGACSASSAGEAKTPTQSGSGCRAC